MKEPVMALVAVGLMAGPAFATSHGRGLQAGRSRLPKNLTFESVRAWQAAAHAEEARRP